MKTFGFLTYFQKKKIEFNKTNKQVESWTS